jgi:hypothetical protein
MNCDDAGGHALDKYGDMIGEGDKGTNGLGHDKDLCDDALGAYGMPAQPLLLAGWVGRAREGARVERALREGKRLPPENLLLVGADSPCDHDENVDGLSTHYPVR